MIKFLNNIHEKPYHEFKKLHDEAVNAKQSFVEAASISSFNKTNNEISSRFVNIKELNRDQFFFYTNYESPKAKDFSSHDQVSINFFWNMTATQIRIKGKIYKASSEKSDIHYESRDERKNFLSIISNQSQPIESYKDFKNKYKEGYENITAEDLKKRPQYWGGYYIRPYYFEFWTGEKFRINKRVSYKFTKNTWNTEILAP